MKHLARILVVVLAVPLTLHAAITVLQPTAGLPLAATQCAGAVISCSYTMPQAPSGTGVLVAFVTFNGLITTLSVIDDGLAATEAWTGTTEQRAGAGTGSKVVFWYGTGGDTTIAHVQSQTNGVQSGSQTVFVAEYSGMAALIDKQAGAFGSVASNPSVASTTPTNANSLLLAGMTHDSATVTTIAAGGTFTLRGKAENVANEVLGYEDLISSSATTAPFTISPTNAVWADKLDVWGPAGAAAGAPTRMLLGVGSGARH